MLHSYHSDSPPWRLLPPPGPRQAVSMRRSNLIAIAILVFFTLGLLIVSFVPMDAHASHPGRTSAKTVNSMAPASR